MKNLLIAMVCIFVFDICLFTMTIGNAATTTTFYPASICEKITTFADKCMVDEKDQSVPTCVSQPTPQVQNFCQPNGSCNGCQPNNFCQPNGSCNNGCNVGCGNGCVIRQRVVQRSNGCGGFVNRSCNTYRFSGGCCR